MQGNKDTIQQNAILTTETVVSEYVQILDACGDNKGISLQNEAVSFLVPTVAVHGFTPDNNNIRNDSSSGPFTGKKCIKSHYPALKAFTVVLRYCNQGKCFRGIFQAKEPIKKSNNISI